MKEETPPRAWGRRLPPSTMRLRMGNTPTGVGKTKVVGGGVDLEVKHPHGRGEDANPGGLPVIHEETPPRAWGRLLATLRRPSSSRNTPTGVGKTRSGHTGRCQPRKHPHGRGEDRHGRCADHGQKETPPRAWGRRFTGAVQDYERRNTPTCVGKT